MADTNRHLLFGLLALQCGFISREQLVAATSAWLEDKSRSLDEVLQIQAALSAERQQLLAALVAEHLKQHDGDAEKSLQALSSVDSVRDELGELGDTDLEQSLVNVPVASEQDRYATRQPSVGQSTSVGQRFRILRPHAKGGLGQVSVARDEELRREVAFKEIQPQHADHPDSQSRFMQEAEITGQLEHPEIVPVYGLGQYADGRPYYAMRFIKGDSLKDAIKRFHQTYQDGGDESGRHLELRKLLGRFVDVCEAIEYAHSRGILHRDLKPGNIMLGKYGETLVVDWGLAKPVDQEEEDEPTELDEPSLQSSFSSGSAATEMGSVIGTPEYMSPEQAAGRLDLVGRVSDVYSLGATLYYLLTNRPPVEGADVETKLQNVRVGEFAPPRTISATVPKALDSICLKAMAREIPDRYHSPGELAEDIEHWLADEPVAAYEESIGERVTRWGRKHRAWAQAGAAALLLVTIVSLVAVTLILRSRNQAIAARDEADFRFAQAREAVDQFFTYVSEDVLLDQPGMQPLRKKLLEEAKSYYEGFLADQGANPVLREETARTHYRVGVIDETLGSPGAAIQQYDSGLRTLDNLEAPADEDLPQRLLRSDLINAKGRALLTLDQPDKALEAFRAARDARQELVKKDPENTTYLRKFASVSMNVALVKNDRRAMEDAQKLRQEILARNPDNDAVQRDLAMGFFNQGIALQRSHNSEGALEAFEMATREFDKCIKRNPGDLTNQNRLALSYRLLADMTEEASEKDEHYTAAYKVAEPLAKANPSVVSFQLSFAVLNLSRAQNQMKLAAQAANANAKFRLYTLALKGFQKAVEILDQHKPSPEVSDDRRIDLAMARLNLARLQLMTEDDKTRNAGKSNLELADEEIKLLRKAHSENKQLQALAAMADTLIKSTNP